MLKAFKYRLYPRKSEKEHINKSIGVARYIYNWGLEIKTKAYTQDKTSITSNDLSNKLPALKLELPWLQEVYSQVLQGSLRNLNTAYTKFFKEHTGFPKFKSKRHHRQSYQLPQNVKVDVEHSLVWLPKLGWVKAKLHREFEGTIKTCTVSRTPSGQYYISILVDKDTALPSKPQIISETTLGIDLGLKDFLITSEGDKVSPLDILQEGAQLRHLQRRLSRKKKGSNNRDKARIRVARQHQRIANKRSDFLHKTSKQLIDENQVDTFALETLNIKGMVKNHKLARSIHSASWSKFVDFLTYKSEWYGKNILRIGMFEPSSKMCSNCGHIKSDLKLKHRTWTCVECECKHDRDVNAAKNIKQFALHPANIVGQGLSKLRASSLVQKACGSCSGGAESSDSTSHHGMKQEAPLF